MISASQAGAYKRCPMAWHFRYVEGRKMAPAWAIKGRAQHKGLELNYRQKVETRADLAVDEVLDAMRSDVEASFHSTTEEPILFPGESKDKIVDDGAAGLRAYHERIAPAVQPVLVEEKVSMTLPWGGTLLGVLDVVDETLTIRDAKFPADPMRAGELIYEAQPPLYATLYHAATGDWPSRILFDVVSLGRGRVPNPKTETFAIPVTPERAQAELRDLRVVEESIKAGIVYRRASSFNCNRCGYRPLCWGRYESAERDLTADLQRSVEALV